ncbi:MAG: response regulator [Desulfobulbaceae bacterium]|nr:response regulator [Desulfobulbaceae bacterium]
MATILLVDDDEMVQSVTSELLTLLGYEVIAADDGQQAIAKAKDNSDLIDLVLLDLSLPDMTGFDLLPLLREILQPRAKIVLCSGSMCEQYEDVDLEEKDLDAVLQKPFELSLLKETVEKVLAS